MQAQKLVDRLLQQEHYPLALVVCRRCGLAERPCWMTWARALIMCVHNPRAPHRANRGPKMGDCLDIKLNRARRELAQLDLDVQCLTYMHAFICIKIWLCAY